MSKMTLTEVVRKGLKLKKEDRASMLGIGPMSKMLIKASILLAKEMHRNLEEDMYVTGIKKDFQKQ